MSWGPPGGSGARSRSSSRQASVSTIPKCLLPKPLRVGSPGSGRQTWTSWASGCTTACGPTRSDARAGSSHQRWHWAEVACSLGATRTEHGRRRRAARRHTRRLRRRASRRRSLGSRRRAGTSPDLARARDASAARCERSGRCSAGARPARSRGRARGHGPGHRPCGLGQDEGAYRAGPPVAPRLGAPACGGRARSRTTRGQRTR